MESDEPDRGRGREPWTQAALRRLPKVDEVLAGPIGQALLAEGPRWAALEVIRGEVARLRQGLLSGAAPPQGGEGERLALDQEALLRALRRRLRPALRPVINATGVVLHTNLGRAPLPQAALQRIAACAGGYANVEYRLDSGERGSRHEHVQALLAPLTGAEAHLIVNNNAAAVLLVLSALCVGREVVVSRGELVEIGGSFRIPDVMRASGAALREVGTTNRTHLRDYEGAIGPGTAALMKVHRSNFAVLGFTTEVEAAALHDLAAARGLHSIVDLGAGALVAPGTLAPELDEPLLPGLAAPPEPTVRQVVGSGCQVVTFSCDKLLGGPQAGVICGPRAIIEKVRQHPLMRALRPDKLTLLALCATLELYRDGRTADIPALHMLSLGVDQLRARAEDLCRAGRGLGLELSVVPVRSAVGGGSLPLGMQASVALSLPAESARGVALLAALRDGEPPVVARCERGRLLCDLRTVAQGQEEALLQALCGAVRTIDGAALSHKRSTS